MWCDTEGPPLQSTWCANGGGVLFSVMGTACLECGKMLYSRTIIKRRSADLSSEAFGLKSQTKNNQNCSFLEFTKYVLGKLKILEAFHQMEHNLNVTKHFSMLTTDTARLSSKTDEKCHMTYKFNFSR